MFSVYYNHLKQDEGGDRSWEHVCRVDGLRLAPGSKGRAYRVIIIFTFLTFGICYSPRYIQSTCATSGEGLYEGLDWLSSNIANKRFIWTIVTAPGFEPSSSPWSTQESTFAITAYSSLGLEEGYVASVALPIKQMNVERQEMDVLNYLKLD
ncbi:hypothetical protein Taro_037036 [Colocasia esculenta]|uniref:Uncharacterized protein n=1 Tax=Colocasia esculenta TaxID=4460 RepID=A0A843W4P1_COLES|nr:hypothetical protein [Colocasia esculenta]